MAAAHPSITLDPEDPASVRVMKKKLNDHARTILSAAETGQLAIASKDQVHHFKVRYERAQKAWDTFQALWDSLQEHHIKSKEEERFPTEDDTTFYNDVLHEMEEASVCVLDIKKWDVPEAAEQVCNTSQTFRSFHLPKIRIPQFDGDLLKWCNFRDIFTSLVHEETSISKVEKFNYLRDALKGEPATLISNMSVTEDTYTLAWDAVKKHYDNPRVLASHYIKRVMEFSPRDSKPSFDMYQEYLREVVDNIEAFKSLNLQDSTEFLLSLLSLRVLDPETRRDFELSHLSTKLPSTKDVFDYIRNRITALRLCSDKDVQTSKPSPPFQNRSQRNRNYPCRSSKRYNSVSFHTAGKSDSLCHAQKSFPVSSKVKITPDRPQSSPIGNKNLCPLCEKDHALHKCLQFNDKSRNERFEFVKKWKGCVNCLRSGHWANSCSSKYCCKFCGKKHHSLLHGDAPDSNTETSCKKMPDTRQITAPSISTSLHTSNLTNHDSKCQVLLGTANVNVLSQNGKMLSVRALLDSCSHHSFVTSRLSRKLGVQVKPSSVSVSGLGGVALNKPSGAIEILVKGHEAQFKVEALVVKYISSASPSLPVRQDVIAEICKENLADRSFGEPGSVEMLIGGDIFAEALTGAPVKTRYAGMILLPTVFGLVVMGKTPVKNSECFYTSSDCSIQPDLEMLVERFWKVEEPESVLPIKPEYAYCERQFIEEHSRNESGRYIVKMPVDPGALALGDSRANAVRRFLSLERKLHADKELGDHYRAFMKEYEELGHMTLAKTPSSYVIPHHGIWQGTSERRKLRVVFDASCPTTHSPDGRRLSLNNILFSGPKLQPDIVDVFIQFRMYAVALTADLVKMYRQVLVHPEQRAMQHILWREDPSLPLRTYELNTVTYGLKPSAFLATRSVRQLVKDESGNFPLAASRIAAAMYVDDFVSGADTEEEARTLREELVGLFSKGGFALGKWSSNIASIIPQNETVEAPLSLSEPDDHSIKILGMVWDPVHDRFTYCAVQPDVFTTKRMLLSTLARLYDPLGLLAPIIFVAKCLLQDVWKSGLGWDDLIPDELLDRWKALTNEWKHISNISVPRYVTFPGARKMLIGFCDASQRGSAAAVYCRSESFTGEVRIHLIKAKSKLAPTHYVSIARLELCGALLLSRMITSIKIPECAPSTTTCFTDSMVVLSWLRTPTYELKTYEANRVNSILEKTNVQTWFHVRSEDNPADLSSRGCSPTTLQNSSLWWNGPNWLLRPRSEWPSVPLKLRDIQRDMPAVTLAINSNTLKDASDIGWMSTFSCLRRLVRTVVRILRFLRRSSLKFSPITAPEYREALVKCIITTQKHAFPSMFLQREVPEAYKNLSPFLGEDGVVRVGGRLKEAPVDYDHKHPMLVPRDSHISRLIVDDVHKSNFHAGPTLALALIRKKFWIPGGLRFVKNRIARCVRCRILKAKSMQPIMASLPRERFSQFHAFVQTGVDFAGPFLIRTTKRRASPRANCLPLEKAYTCLFICLASRAVHIECVSSLTTEGFLAALDRFISRRGTPKVFHSDNGTNFVGARNYLYDVYQFLKDHETDILDRLTPQGIDWKFIPPRAPNFGGSWEAGVKSTKTLLAHSISKQPFTFEELDTILTRIEGLLNSRPLCPLSEDVSSWDVLTPGHFLAGGALQQLPEVGENSTTSPRTRWDTVRKQTEHVWERWKAEYLHYLQQKGKWLQDSPNPRIGDLVILVEKQGITGYLLFLILGSILAITGIATLIWKPVDILLHERIRMVRGLPPFEWWKNPPDEVLLRAYVFNITNSKEYLSGDAEKLHVEEVGPFIYREKLYHTNIRFHENGSMTYTASRVPIFLPEMNTLSLDSKITVANLAVLGMTSYMWDASFVPRLGLNMIINRLGSEPFIEISVRDYLWNFTDPLIGFTNKITPHLVPVENMGILQEVYRDFVDNVTVYVGVDNGPEKFFKIDKWRGMNGLGAWENETCDSVRNASEGVSYHQYVKRTDTIKYLRKTICRAFDLHYEEDVNMYGITAYKFVLPNNTWNRPADPDDECYTVKRYPLYPSGVSDISPCYYNLPIVTSFPHLMSSQPEVTNRLEGLSPDWEKHGSLAIIEPLTGIPLTATARSQVSLYMHDMKSFPKYKRLSKMAIPMFWLEYNQVGLPNYIKYLLYSTVVILPAIQFYISLGLITTAFIIFSVVSSKMLNNFIVKKQGAYTAVSVVFGKTLPLSNNS